MLKVSVARENVRDSQFAHDDERSEINERDIRLVVILLAQLPRALELLGRDMNEIKTTLCGLLKKQFHQLALGLLQTPCRGN